MRLTELLRTRLIDPIRQAQGSPESIARGGALGMWVALTPTVGIQMLMVLVLSVPFRANVAVGLAMCWITNPVTLVFFYFGFYWLGAHLLGRQVEGFGEVAEHLRQAFGGGGIDHAILVLGGEILWPMVLGSIVIASVCSVPTYHLLLAAFRRREAADQAGVEGPAGDGGPAGPAAGVGSPEDGSQGEA